MGKMIRFFLGAAIRVFAGVFFVFACMLVGYVVCLEVTSEMIAEKCQSTPSTTRSPYNGE